MDDNNRNTETIITELQSVAAGVSLEPQVQITVTVDSMQDVKNVQPMHAYIIQQKDNYNTSKLEQFNLKDEQYNQKQEQEQFISKQEQFISKQEQFISKQEQFISKQEPFNTKQEPFNTSDQTSEPRLSKKDRKREAIDGQAREIIFKVIKFFESEKQNRGYAFSVDNVMKRASAATGLSESTIKRIKRDGLKAEATNTKIPGPKKKRIRKTKVQLDYYQLCALRGIVNSYNDRKELPTLTKILASAKNEINYRGGKESLRLILLNKLGIKFKKCEKKVKPKPEEPLPVQTVQQPQQQPSMVVVHAPSAMPMHHQLQQMKPQDNSCLYGSLMPTMTSVPYTHPM